jgi:hypothetical protein
MRRNFDIQFFGGGGSKVRRYPKRDPESPELQNIKKKLYEAILPSVEAYDPSGWDLARKRADNALGMQGQFLGMLPGAMEKGNGILDEMLGVIRSGNIPQGLTDRMNASVNKELQGGMGNMLNSLGSRGVLNSSITSQGVSRLGQQAADAYNKNYLAAFNSVLQGYGQGMQGAHANTSALLQGADMLGKVPGQAYEAAGAQLMPAFNLWKAMQDSYDRKEDYDTVVKQGK